MFRAMMFLVLVEVEGIDNMGCVVQVTRSRYFVCLVS